MGGLERHGRSGGVLVSSRQLTVNGQVVELDGNGYLRDVGCWSKELAQVLAEEDGLILQPEHWEIILFLRAHYEQYATAPPMRALVKVVAKRLGPEKGNSRYLYRLFSDGPAKQASRYAGLPKPTSCI